MNLAEPETLTPNQTAPAPFVKPSPGTWTLDAAHCERPMARIMQEIFETNFAAANREGALAYGLLLDTIEARFVNGFVYTCVRPMGAPPEPKGAPPRFVFALLSRLSPAIRKRNRIAERALTEKLWREEVRLYLEEWLPPIDARAKLLQMVSLSDLSDSDVAEHVEACHKLLFEGTYLHHRLNCTRMLPVGDFIAHVGDWTGATPSEILQALRGSSPHSAMGHAEAREVLKAIIAAEISLDGYDDRESAEEFLAELELRDDAVGSTVRTWLDKVGHMVTGFSPGYPTLRELPEMMVATLRQAAKSDKVEEGKASSEKRVAELRRRVPAEHQTTFDELLEEARFVYFIRDHSALHACADFGMIRLAMLECGRRLEAKGKLEDPEHALDLVLHEAISLLKTGKGPSSDEVKKRSEWRLYATAEMAPEFLGPPPGDPAPFDALPTIPARLHRALFAYVDAMFGEQEVPTEEAMMVKGLPASPGRRVGTARLVLNLGDFSRVKNGDILVTRITTPSYNVLLPLLGGVVTDRGGILSHPAIVSREFGIPAVVGCRVATAEIPDGARIEIDGDAGTIRVLT